MKTEYQVRCYVKDNIPGFKDSDDTLVKSFDTKEAAEAFLGTLKNSSEYHPGFGAGSGSIDTTYYIEEIKK